MRKVPLTPEKQGLEKIPQSKNTENAENADTKTRKMWKKQLTGLNVTGFRWPPPPPIYGQESAQKSLVGNCLPLFRMFCSKPWQVLAGPKILGGWDGLIFRSTILFKIITRTKLLFWNYLGRYSYSFRPDRN